MIDSFVLMNFKNGKKNFFLIGFIIIASLFQVGASQSEHITSGEIVVDFAQPVKVNSMSGLLHSVSVSKPLDEMIMPLKPKQWRTGEKNPLVYERIKKTGARTQIVLSDFWGYPGLNTNRPWSYENYSEFEEFVRQVARTHNSNEVIWDVWNEPDDPKLPFWKGTFLQFCETYLRAYKILRQELGPDAIIGGPSFSRYNKSRLKDFLDYCATNGCEVNFLSWHELDDRRISGIADRLDEARKLFVDNPAYKNLKIKEIQINEIVGSRAQNSPGAILGYFYYLEKGKADGASKACWENSGSEYNCYNDTLDGLLRGSDLLPTSAWWVYKAYADGIDLRVRADSTNPHLIGLGSAGSNSANQAQILVGYYRESSSQAVTANVSLNLKNIDKLPFVSNVQNLNVKIEKIQNSGERAVKSLELVSQDIFPNKNNSIRLSINDISVNEVYLVTISNVN